MPNQVPNFLYEDQAREIQVEYDGNTFISYSDVDRDSYEMLVAIDEFVTQSTTLVDDLMMKTTEQVALQRENVLLDSLPVFQERAVDDYDQCLQFQEELEEADSNLAENLRGLLYKHEKLLKHYFRVLSIVQSLAVSYRLGFESLDEDGQLYLYPFIQSVCSTIEYLGQAVENRLGGGRIDLEQTGENAVSVYRELKNQGLADPQIDVDGANLADVEVVIPPRNVTKPLSDLPITVSSMQWLWDKRCQIVHTPPLIIADQHAKTLSDDFLSSHLLSKTDVRKLTELSFRVHLHSTLLFIKYLSSYLRTMIPPMVEILYPEDRDK